MKKYALILAALVSGAVAQAQDSASSYNVTVDFPYASKYVFRGLELARDSFQPSVKVVSGNMYASLWTNQPLTNGEENEIDLAAGYNYKLNDKWSLDAGLTYYYYPEANTRVSDEYTTEAYLGLNGSIKALSVGVYLYRDFNINSYTAQANFGYSVVLSDTASLNLGANVGRVTNVGPLSYTYYGASAQIPFKLNKATTFTVGVNYSTHNNNLLSLAVGDDNIWFNTGITVGF
jgi:uncharacterized protein (TIGR02001 family)